MGDSAKPSRPSVHGRPSRDWNARWRLAERCAPRSWLLVRPGSRTNVWKLTASHPSERMLVMSAPFRDRDRRIEPGRLSRCCSSLRSERRHLDEGAEPNSDGGAQRTRRQPTCSGPIELSMWAGDRSTASASLTRRVRPRPLTLLRSARQSRRRFPANPNPSRQLHRSSFLPECRTRYGTVNEQ